MPTIQFDEQRVQTAVDALVNALRDPDQKVALETVSTKTLTAVWPITEPAITPLILLYGPADAARSALALGFELGVCYALEGKVTWEAPREAEVPDA